MPASDSGQPSFDVSRGCSPLSEGEVDVAKQSASIHEMNNMHKNTRLAPKGREVLKNSFRGHGIILGQVVELTRAEGMK